MPDLLLDETGDPILDESAGLIYADELAVFTPRVVGPAPVFKFLAADLLTGDIFDEVPLADVVWTPALNGAGQWSATIASDDPRAGLLQEARTVVYVCSERRIWWPGIVWGVSWASDRKLKVAGTDLWGYPEHRRLRADRTYTAQDQLTVAADLLTFMQSGTKENVGLTVRRHPSSSGIARTQAYLGYQRPTFAELVAGLAVLDQGFDFAASAEWVADGQVGRYVDLWWPGRGQRQNLVWEHGKNCAVTAYSRDGTAFANRWDTSGNASGGANLIGSASSAPGVFARFDGFDSASDAGTQAIVDARASSGLARAHQPLEAVTVALSAERASDTDPQAGWQVGDEVYLVAHDGWLDLDGYYRIVDAQYKIDNESGQLQVPQVSLALNLPGVPVTRPNWYAKVEGLLGRVQTLERR